MSSAEQSVFRTLPRETAIPSRDSAMTSNRKFSPLAAGYTSEIDAVNEPTWCQLLSAFNDANIYQTWSYAEVSWGLDNTSHLVLKKDGRTVAVAQVRVVKIPFVNIGIAYVRWGPIWQRSTEVDEDIFRQAVRALRNEFTCKRNLLLRLFPALFDVDSPCYSTILQEEGLSLLRGVSDKRTILMDLSPSLDSLREGMLPHWKRELKVAERKQLQVIEGDQDDLFAAFIEIYKEMVSRKQFVEPNDINHFRLIQAKLPTELKMRIMLCKSGDETSSGLICSAIGNKAVYLFGATSNAGMKSRGSYLLHWKLLETLKQQGISVYDLNGINPARNPGTYKFKSDLAGSNGREVLFMGRFEAHPGNLEEFCVKSAESARTIFRNVRESVRASFTKRLKEANVVLRSRLQ
jgi:lipid II:glycine glycyltransferase (peptidoglycan interpeptide bridge formation enzyme)